MTRLIDAGALTEDLEKVYEFYMNEIKEANENPDNYTSKFIPATAGIIDGIVEAEIAIHNAPTIEPDGDTISRQDAIEAIRKSMSKSETEDSLHYNLGLGVAEEVVNSLPSAPDSRQRGEWLWDSGDGEYFCSECRTAQGNSTTEIISGEWKFCPNCGADMRKGDNNGNGI